MSARPLLGHIPGRTAALHADGRAGVASRRQMPGHSRRDEPLRVTQKVVYASYTPTMPSKCWPAPRICRLRRGIRWQEA